MIDNLPPLADKARLLAYFAAHAPLDIPRWFSTPPAKPLPRLLPWHEALTLAPGWSTLSSDRRTVAAEYMRDPCFDPDDDVAEVCRQAQELILEFKQRRDQAENAALSQRYFAWRWHYAREMLALMPLQEPAEEGSST